MLVTKISLHVHFLTFARIECIFRLMFIVKAKKRMHKFVILIRAKRERKSLSLYKKELMKENVCKAKKVCA